MYSKSNLLINNQWHEILIVTSPQPIKCANNSFVDTNDYYETTYYVTNNVQSSENGGIYIKWYILKSTTVKERETNQLKQEVLDLTEQTIDNDYRISVLELGL